MPPSPDGRRDALIGRVVAGKFKIQELLGVGAMGRVYRAHHEALEKVIALKVLNPGLSQDEGAAIRFKAEARAASRLDHPNSVQILDFGEDGAERMLYIAMEYLQGQNLGALLKRVGRLSQRRAVQITSQVLAALAAAHRAGVVHRDLKPANIMLVKRADDDGEVNDFVKVCDFGIAKVMDTASPDEATAMTMTKAGAVFGTPSYMSPEQARGEKVDHRTDLYSAGVILYRMLAGRAPYQAETAMGLLTKLMTEEPAPLTRTLSTIDPRLEELVFRAMAKDRTRRFQSATDMRAALKELAEGPGEQEAGEGEPAPARSSSSSGSFPPLEQPPAGRPGGTVPPRGLTTRPPATQPPPTRGPEAEGPSPQEARAFRTFTQTGWTRSGPVQPVPVAPSPGLWDRWRKPLLGAVAAAVLALIAWPAYRSWDHNQAVAELEQHVATGAFGAAENLFNDRFDRFAKDDRALARVEEILERRRNTERYEERGVRYDPAFAVASGSWTGIERLPEAKMAQRIVLTIDEVLEHTVSGTMDWPDSGVRAAVRGLRSGNHLVLWDWMLVSRPALMPERFTLNDKKVVFVYEDKIIGWDGPYQAKIEAQPVR